MISGAKIAALLLQMVAFETFGVFADELPTGRKTKIFGLGLSKTGTTSMAAAMEELGYVTTHTDRSLAHFMHHQHGSLDLAGYYDDVDSVWDIPTAAYYRELIRAYPDAKFVLTVRDSEKWYKSFQDFHNEYLYYKWGCEIPERVQRLHEFVYGSRIPNKSWISAYEKHNQEVQAFFSEQAPKQLLTIDISEGNPWPKVCEFLDTVEGPCADSKALPDFPHANHAAEHGVVKECPKTLMDEFRDSKVPDGENFAYVTMLCDPDFEDQAEYIRMLLVLGENIREYDQQHDIVTMVHGTISDDKFKLLEDEGFKVYRIKDVGTDVSYPPTDSMDARATSCYRSKIRALQLTQYDKIMFLDNDLLLKQDLQHMFHEPGFNAFQGYESPLNSGLFVVEPSQKAFNDLRDIASSNSFHPQDGWLNSGPFPHWRLEGEMSDWTFWGSHVDQGLLYYYYDKIRQQATLKQPDTKEIIFTHFTGKNKPFLHSPDNLETMRGKSRDSLIHWYQLWDVVKARLDTRKKVNGSETPLMPSDGEVLDSFEMVSEALLKAHESIHLVLGEDEKIDSRQPNQKTKAKKLEFDESPVKTRIGRALGGNDTHRRGRKNHETGIRSALGSSQQKTTKTEGRIERVLGNNDPYRKLEKETILGSSHTAKKTEGRIDRVLGKNDPYGPPPPPPRGENRRLRKLEEEMILGSSHTAKKTQGRIQRVLGKNDPYEPPPPPPRGENRRLRKRKVETEEIIGAVELTGPAQDRIHRMLAKNDPYQ